MPITPLPPPPNRSTQDRATFVSTADAFLGALPVFVADANDLASDMNSTAAFVTAAGIEISADADRAEAAASFRTSVAYKTYAQLAASTAAAGITAAVFGPDAGTHTDPVVGGSVANVGIYRYSTSPAGWEWLDDLGNLQISDVAGLQSALNGKASLTSPTFANGLEVVGGVGAANRVILTGDGAIELSRAGGGAYIDFKDDLNEDFDVRIRATGTRLSIGSSGVALAGAGLPDDTIGLSVGKAAQAAHFVTDRFGVLGVNLYLGDGSFRYAGSEGHGYAWAATGVNGENFRLLAAPASTGANGIVPSVAERLSVLSNGFVGINNSDPSQVLDVGGNIHCSGSINTGSSMFVRRRGDEGGEIILQKGLASSLGGDVFIDQLGNRVRFYVSDGVSSPQFNFDFTANTLTMPNGATVWHSGTFNPATKLDRAVDTWITDSGGANRFFFSSGGGMFYRGVNHEWRNAADGPIARMSAEGDWEFLGQTQKIMAPAPTLWWQDTDNRTFAIHVNSDLAYFMRGGTNSSVWTTLANGEWPIVLNLNNGETRFGANMAVVGNITATGDITAFSDERLKEHVETIPNALDKVKHLRGVTYRRKDTEQWSTGVIAQEVLPVLPEVVHTDGDHMSVAYGNMVGVLIEAIKELSAEVEDLKRQLP